MVLRTHISSYRSDANILRTMRIRNSNIIRNEILPVILYRVLHFSYKTILLSPFLCYKKILLYIMYLIIDVFIRIYFTQQ